ncbi:hypothetical protein GSI_11208 [Ganoderma sinense ZZ0214-1]|uniref:Protein kinase domain-containing protein n=1 Tax=Ganoderma sinense ZZ0214-1 TaxID=1077348 RepID=A0A2G8RYX7_9APHY|nr:hypothetical protein GSI_11208 [Ganoderma sinense ZZ0214-1]
MSLFPSCCRNTSPESFLKLILKHWHILTTVDYLHSDAKLRVHTDIQEHNILLHYTVAAPRSRRSRTQAEGRASRCARKVAPGDHSASLYHEIVTEPTNCGRPMFCY